jgi:hypothetical protein
LGRADQVFLGEQEELEALVVLSVQQDLVDQVGQEDLVVVVGKSGSSQELALAVSCHHDRFHLDAQVRQEFRRCLEYQEYPWVLVGTCWVVVEDRNCIQILVSSVS